MDKTSDILPVGEAQVAEALAALRRYKAGKANLESRIIEDELWWELRHWEAVGRGGRRAPGKENLRRAEPTSAWLFNSIANKHADAMDNYPEPVVLPREASDEESARMLSQVLPVILENSDFARTYSDNWWEKLKHGTAVYGVFWNAGRENGLGDVDIRMIDLLNLYWEPGITDIQKSRNLFTTELVDNDLLVSRWPELEGKLGASAAADVPAYLYDDAVDTEGKSVVVDWYYKTALPGGAERLHYAKIVGDTLLYASENDPACAGTGFYAHGRYPFVLDTLFPEKGTPVGFGYVAVCKDPQLYIDKLFGNILDYSLKATHPRHFIASSTGVNEQEYLDWEKPLVHVEGTLDDTRIRQIALEPLSGLYANVLQMKIEEMKDTSSNRDVNAGGVSGGVTAASAIAALQESGSKVSRDMIAASYRADSEITALVIELMRQFYDESRSFRITGAAPGEWSFAEVSAALLRERRVGVDASGAPLVRRPVFDLKISAQKRNPFSRMEQNERAKELFGLGFFNPDRAQEALGALEMMDFEGVDKVREQVRKGQTLAKVCERLSEQLSRLAGALPAAEPDAARDGDGSVPAARMPPRPPAEDYAARLARRSAPSGEGA